MSISDNIHRVRERIAEAAARAGRDPGEVGLVCVTKTVDLPEVREAVEAGITIVGENRVGEGRRKRESLSGLSVCWHFIGHLQTNKVKQALEVFDFIHSVDSLKLAREIGRRADQAGKTMPVLLEVNVSGEEAKFGFSPEALRGDLDALGEMEGIRIEGLMTMAPFVADPEEVRPVMVGLRELAEQIAGENRPAVSMQRLSMGMTQDYEVAVEEGATLVRIGSAIFSGM